MKPTRFWQDTDFRLLALLALSKVLVHTFTNGEYGFHRDELATVDDAGYLAWGYVAYPPMTPFVARMALELFGPSLVGVRFFAALAQGVALALGGMMAGELGGKRPAQIVAALAVAIAPEVRGQHPPKIIERDILEQCTRTERDRDSGRAAPPTRVLQS